jgi:hypothetical protein
LKYRSTRQNGEKIRQKHLYNLAEDLLNYWNEEEIDIKFDLANNAEWLIRNLELDGYSYKDNKLLMPESDVLDVEEEMGVLESLYRTLVLNNKETAFHHLKLSEEHYLESKWDDSISNSRKFLEAILQEVASAHSLRTNNVNLPEDVYTWPAKIRDYLMK